MVLAMSKRGFVSIPARAPARVRAQVPKEGAGGGRASEHDQPGRVLRSRGASYMRLPMSDEMSCHHLRSDTNLDPI